MPTNYAGVKTNTQSPSVVPQNEGVPTVALPADGDFPNASLYAQGYKVLADWIAYCLAPVVKVAASAADWARSLIRWRAANGHTRSHIDHLGLVSGRIQNWREHWDDVVSAGGLAGTAGAVDLNCQTAFGTLNTELVALGTQLTLASAGADLAATQAKLATAATHATNAGIAALSISGLSPWKVKWKQTTGSSAVSTFNPTSGTIDRFRWAGLVAGDTAGDYILLYKGAPALWSADSGLKLEWEAQLEAADLVKDTVTVGLCVDGGLATSSGANDFATFILGPGGGNWTFQTRSGGGTVTGVGTGVAASTSWVRFKIEWHGGNVAEDAAPAIRAYINNTLVATVTSGLPAATARLAPHFCVTNTGGGAAGLTAPLRLGPVSFGSNLYPADVT